MKKGTIQDLPLGPSALILSKHYYGVLSKSLEHLDIDRYYAVLYYLSGQHKCSQQQICNALAIDKTAMVKVMDYLIDAGFVQRKINPDDRREHFISLSARGKRKTATVVNAFDAIDREIFEGISKNEQQTFFRVMSRLKQRLKELPSNDLFFNYKKTRSQDKPVSKRKKK